MRELTRQFVRTPLYVQIWGMWDGTKVNIVSDMRPSDALLSARARLRGRR